MKYRPLTDVRYLVVHCSATLASQDIGAKEIDLWHRQRGFLKIGYHAVIRRDGTVEPGRPLDQPGAHAVRFNNVSLGVCMVGGCRGVDKNRDNKIQPNEFVPENNFTPAQFASLERVLREWKSLHPSAVICGHTNLDPGKACPSFDVAEWLTTVGLS